jgi:hypothetical protein
MKKYITMLCVFAIGFLLVSCIEIPVSNVTSISLSGWEPREIYQKDENVNLSQAMIRVTFDNDDTQSYYLSSSDIEVQPASAIQDNKLNTMQTGEKTLLISYNNVSITVSYLVVDHLVKDGDDIATKIAGVEDGGVLYFAPGTFTLCQTFEFETKSIEIIGSSDQDNYPTTILRQGDCVLNTAFRMTGENSIDVVIRNLILTDFNKDSMPGGSYVLAGVIETSNDFNGSLVVDHVVFKDFAKNGVQASGGDVIVSNSHFDGTKSYLSGGQTTNGVVVAFDAVGSITNSTFINFDHTDHDPGPDNDIFGAGVIFRYGAQYDQIIGNTFEDNNDHIRIDNDPWESADLVSGVEGYEISGNTYPTGEGISAYTYTYSYIYDYSVSDLMVVQEEYSTFDTLHNSVIYGEVRLELDDFMLFINVELGGTNAIESGTWITFISFALEPEEPGGSVILDDGSILYVEPDATLELWDTGLVLEGNAELHVHASATTIGLIFNDFDAETNGEWTIYTAKTE